MTRANRNLIWIETHCVGTDGKPIGVPAWQRAIVRQIFDGREYDEVVGKRLPTDPDLAECLRQLFAFGPEAMNVAEAALAYSAHIGRDGWPSN
jgi:hypothetical protein